MLYFNAFGEVRIYRPSPTSEVALRIEAEEDLRSNYVAAKYSDKADINKIVQHRFDFFDTQLRQLLPRIVNRDFMAFALHQYELSHEIEENHKENKLTREEAKSWKKLGTVYRRAIKYLAECMTMYQPLDRTELSTEERIDISDRCWSCCEQLVEHSFLSSQTYALFPDKTTLIIHPEGSDPYIELTVDEYESYAQFGDRMSKDRSAREKYLGASHMLFDPTRVSPYLDDIMKESCGFSYTQGISIAAELNEGAVPRPMDSQSRSSTRNTR